MPGSSEAEESKFTVHYIFIENEASVVEGASVVQGRLQVTLLPDSVVRIAEGDGDRMCCLLG